MKDKLKAHFLKFGPKTFVAVTVLVLLILDVINSYYMKLYWHTMDMSNKLIFTMAKIQHVSLEDMSSESLSQLQQFIDKMFMFFILIVFANNLFFYFFYLRKKLWAQGFVLVYALTAALFSLTFIFDGAKLGVGWLIYNLATTFIYVYIFAGVKVTKLETTLVDEKKGR